jgi:hypothetical protein
MILKDFLVVVLSYFAVLVLAVLIISFIQRRYFWKFIKAKTSGGKLLLLKVRDVVQPYYRTAKISEGTITFKASDGQEKRLTNIPEGAIYRDMGVNCIDINGVTWQVYTFDGAGETSFDPDKANSLFIRALYKPSTMQTKMVQILIIISALTLLLVIACVFLSYQSMKTSKLALEGVNYIRTVMVNASSTIL